MLGFMQNKNRVWVWPLYIEDGPNGKRVVVFPYKEIALSVAVAGALTFLVDRLIWPLLN